MSESLYNHERGPNCPTTEEIEIFAAGGEVGDAVAAHAATCAACKAVVEQIRADANAVDGYLDALSAPPTEATRSRYPGVPESLDVSPDLVPGYKVVGLLGQGGQGSVYKAVQLGTKREVAIKLLRAGRFATTRQRLRMEREAEIIASLKHPNIVTVHESRYLDSNRYAMVMEFLDGEPLDKWTPTGRTPRERREALLRVFVQVCEGVNHAHRNGVAHRDLKPSNVLVDREGLPHILDFGIAKSIGQDGATLTATGESAFTLHYASPEQVSIGDAQIDFRTDVYSLGVMLYVLLCGTFPYPLEGSILAAIKAIREMDPKRLREIDRTIDLDLETIVLKALQKDRSRRYNSPHELGRDLERYLNREAIDARRDSVMYVLAMRLRRNWLPLTIGAGLAIAGVVVWWTTLEGRRAKEQRTQRDKEATSNAVVVGEMLPSRLAGEERREVVDRLRGLQTAADLGVLPDDPALHTSIMNVAGTLAQEFNLEWAAEWSQREALIAARQNPTAEGRDLSMARSKHGLAQVLRTRPARLGEARALALEALDLRRRRLGANDPEVAESLELLGRIEGDLGNPAAERQRVESARRIFESAGGDQRLGLARCDDARARAAIRQGDVIAAAAMAESALRTRLSLRRDTHPEVLESLRRFAEWSAASERGSSADATNAEDGWRTWSVERWRTLADDLDRTREQFTTRRFADALGELAGLKRRMFGNDSREAAETMASHAWWLVRSERTGQAVGVFEALVPMLEKLHGPRAIAVANAWEQIALCQNWLGDRAAEKGPIEDALPRHRAAIEAYERCLAILAENPAYASDAGLMSKLRIQYAESWVNAALHDESIFDRADAACRDAIESTKATAGPEFYRLPAAMQKHAELLRRRADRRAEAWEIMRAAVDLRVKLDPKDDPWLNAATSLRDAIEREAKEAR